MSSKQIKKDLVSDLVTFSSNLKEGQVDHFLIEPEELNDRDDVTDRHVSIYFGFRSPNITVGGSSNFDTIHEMIVQVYVSSHRQKGSEEYYEELFNDICDDVFNWLQSISTGNEIYNITGGKLRVPTDNETDFFTDQEEPIRFGKSTYTRFHIEPIRKS